MALISPESTIKIEKYRNTVHEKVQATYTVFEANDQKYVQIDTYGRIRRKNPENQKRLASHCDLTKKPRYFSLTY